MTDRSGSVERAADLPPIPAEVAALQRLSASGQILTHVVQRLALTV
jgi:hypothetical protein